MNLEMSRIKDYLKIIAEKDGIPVCNDVAHYVFVVLAQFLQIVVGIQSILSTIVTHLIALIEAPFVMSLDMRYVWNLCFFMTYKNNS